MKLPKKSFHRVFFLLKLYISVAFRQKESDNKRKKQEESIWVGEGMKEVLKRGMLKFPCRPMCIGNDNPTCFDWGDCLCCP